MWNGKSWQQHINQILHIHHLLIDTNYFEVPDKVGGDGGLEGFSSNGHAYQCYCDEGSQATAERVTKQKAKITEDLGKLRLYETFWTNMLHDIKIRTWHLVVPVVEDKDVLKHARTKAAEIRKQNLPFIHSKFDATICTDTAFAEAYTRVLGDAPPTIRVDAELVDSTHVSKFESAETAFVSNTDRKVQQIAPHKSSSDWLEIRRGFLGYHLRGSNILSKLQNDAPPLWEKLTVFIQEQEDAIRMESMLSQGGAEPRLKTTRELLETRLAKLAPKLDQGQVLTLSWGTIAAWLGECPLDF